LLIDVCNQGTATFVCAVIETELERIEQAKINK
jgi:hypothetical protein